LLPVPTFDTSLLDSVRFYFLLAELMQFTLSVRDAATGSDVSATLLGQRSLHDAVLAAAGVPQEEAFSAPPLFAARSLPLRRRMLGAEKGRASPVRRAASTPLTFANVTFSASGDVIDGSLVIQRAVAVIAPRPENASDGVEAGLLVQLDVVKAWKGELAQLVAARSRALNNAINLGSPFASYCRGLACAGAPATTTFADTMAALVGAPVTANMSAPFLQPISVSFMGIEELPTTSTAGAGGVVDAALSVLITVGCFGAAVVFLLIMRRTRLRRSPFTSTVVVVENKLPSCGLVMVAPPAGPPPPSPKRMLMRTNSWPKSVTPQAKS
jgi:hypothetical protein